MLRSKQFLSGECDYIFFCSFLLLVLALGRVILIVKRSTAYKSRWMQMSGKQNQENN